MIAGDETVRRNRVLVVDDKPIVRDAVRVLLEMGGFMVVGEAEDGIGAISRCAQLDPDFVVLDFSMPKVDGRIAAEAIRRFCPEVTIVVFSADLESRPPWGDAFVPKDSIDDIVPVLDSLSGDHALSVTTAPER